MISHDICKDVTKQTLHGMRKCQKLVVLDCGSFICNGPLQLTKRGGHLYHPQKFLKSMEQMKVRMDY